MAKKTNKQPERQNTQTNQHMSHMSDSVIMPTQKKQNQSQNCNKGKDCR